MKGTFKMKNDSKYRIVVLAAAAMAASALSAMPTKNDLAKAQPIVNELMGPLVNSFRAKKTKASEVGAKAEEYAREAETEAAKFLLLKGAITYYSHAEEYDKAADAVDELGRAVKDIPPDTMLDIISRATSRIGEANAPRLYAQYRLVSARSQAEKMVAKMKALAAKRPADDTVRRRYAEALAASGNWSAALDEFAKAKGKPGEIAAAEKSGKGKPGDIAEFWWGYEPEEQYASEAIKRHAAEFYQKAFADGSISGLKKTLAEKRVASLGPVVESGAAAAALASEPEKQAAVGAIAGLGKVQAERGIEDIQPFSVELENADKIEFIRCPAGEFMMGWSAEDVMSGSGHKDAFTLHHVKITRPFLLSKWAVTRKQWSAIMGENDYKDGKKAIPNIASARVFFNMLEKRIKDKIPKGYEIRFPTEAEHEYALKSGGNRKDDLFAKYHVGKEDEKQVIEGQNHWMIGDMRTPTSWRLCFQDTVGFVADDDVSFQGGSVKSLKYEKTMIDPIWMKGQDGEDTNLTWEGGWCRRGAYGKGRGVSGNVVFHIAIAPSIDALTKYPKK